MKAPLERIGAIEESEDKKLSIADVLHLIYIGIEVGGYRLVKPFDFSDEKYIISRTSGWYRRLALRLSGLFEILILLSMAIFVVSVISLLLIIIGALWYGPFLEVSQDMNAGFWLPILFVSSTISFFGCRWIEDWCVHNVRWIRDSSVLGDRLKKEIITVCKSFSEDIRYPCSSYDKDSGIVSVKMHTGEKFKVYFERR
jgi:hypothetical protein